MKVESVDSWVVCLEKKWRSILLTPGSHSGKESWVLCNPQQSASCPWKRGEESLETWCKGCSNCPQRIQTLRERRSKSTFKEKKCSHFLQKTLTFRTRSSKGLKMNKVQIKLFQGEPNYLLKTLKGCSISDRILFCVTFIFVIFASAGRFRSSDKIRHGRVIDCPDLIFLIKKLQPQFLWQKILPRIKSA